MSMRTDSPYHDDHLRHLLNQRTARADLHGRFPSLSEASDSPSVYSHALFSPVPVERNDIDAPRSHTPSSHHRQPSEPQSPMSDRQRLNIPHASSLDLDDDPRSSYADSHRYEEEDDVSTEEEEGELHRVSAYGPKMIVHSRAPWETGEEDVEELEEPSSANKRSGFKFSKGDSGKKVKGSGRNVLDARSSMESIRSQAKGKHSFDTVSSNISAGGALLALAQASMSSTSLAISQASSPHSSLRDKLALPRFRSRTPSNTNKSDSLDTRMGRQNLSSPSPRSSPASHYRALSPTAAEFCRTDSRPSYVEPSSPHTPLHQQEYHPYANPDLVRAFARDTSPARRLEELQVLTSATSVPDSPTVSRSESLATLTESSTSTTLATPSQSRSDNTISMTPGTSFSSVQNDLSSPTARSFVTKDISPPIRIDGASSQRGSNDSQHGSGAGSKRETAFMPLGGMPSWAEGVSSAPIKLISLEEAQAQARERSRSATANGMSMTSPMPSSSQTRPPQKSQSTRSRMRTASASGSKTKNFASASAIDLHSTFDTIGENSPAMNGAPAQRPVVRKKSGFMRLFNGKDKVSMPPVPSISMEVASPIPPPPARARKHSMHRVPVPSLTASLLVDEEGGSSGSISASPESRSDTEVSQSHSNSTRSRQLSVRRNVPGLSINTSAQPGSIRTIETALTPLTGATDVTFNSTMSSPDPRSAEFVALSLRPVSTLFSAFTGQIDSAGSDRSRPSLDPDMGTPTTSTTAISPRSPTFPLRADSRQGNEKSGVVNEDQSSVIQALQEQILAARRAWQRQVWELEGQVRDLKAEVDHLRATDEAKEYCPACGRGAPGKPADDAARIGDLRKAGVKVGGVVNRPRARTGVGSRFASGT